MKSKVLFVITFTAGAFFMLLVWGICHFSHAIKYFLQGEKHFFSSEIYTTTRTYKFDMPEKAWNLNYYERHTGPDSELYLSFKTDPATLKKFIEEIKLDKTGKPSSGQLLRNPVFMNGMPVVWWPEISDKFDFWSKDLFLLMSDPETGIVYIHVFTM